MRQNAAIALTIRSRSAIERSGRLLFNLRELSYNGGFPVGARRDAPAADSACISLRRGRLTGQRASHA